ncbi:phosphoglycolate phosphatase [Aliiglaciecola aliphaticivorans]
MIRTKNVLLFDLDGTLVHSAPDLALAVNKTLLELNRSPFDKKTIYHWVGNGARVLVARALSGTSTINEKLDDTVIEDALAIFMKHYEQCLCVESVLYEGVKQGLNSLKSAGFRLAIITNKPAVFIEPILKGLELNNIFEILIGGDTLPQKKPHPAPLLHAIEKLNVSAEQCIMIGDSKNDILAAKAAKITSIGVTYGYNYGESIANSRPDRCYDTFNELTSALLASK